MEQMEELRRKASTRNDVLQYMHALYVNVLMCISFLYLEWQERELGDINNKLKVNVFNWTSKLYIKSFLVTMILC